LVLDNCLVDDTNSSKGEKGGREGRREGMRRGVVKRWAARSNTGKSPPPHQTSVLL
jgi:hypothetical protein